MVTVRFKDELKDLLTDTGTRVISDNNLPRLVRQLVVHINVSEHLLLCCGTRSYKSVDFADLQQIETSPKAQVFFLEYMMSCDTDIHIGRVSHWVQGWGVGVGECPVGVGEDCVA